MGGGAHCKTQLYRLKFFIEKKKLGIKGKENQKQSQALGYRGTRPKLRRHLSWVFGDESEQKRPRKEHK